MARSHSIKARRDVILSGGAINTPQLLQISGIGNPDDLAAIGVAVKHALPGVGHNFRDHYAIRVSALVKGAGSLNEKSRGLRLVGEVLRYAISRKGLLTTAPQPCRRLLQDAARPRDARHAALFRAGELWRRPLRHHGARHRAGHDARAPRSFGPRAPAM